MEKTDKYFAPELNMSHLKDILSQAAETEGIDALRSIADEMTKEHDLNEEEAAELHNYISKIIKL